MISVSSSSYGWYRDRRRSPASDSESDTTHHDPTVPAPSMGGLLRGSQEAEDCPEATGGGRLAAVSGSSPTAIMFIQRGTELAFRSPKRQLGAALNEHNSNDSK
jgi:hypothetical protein